MSYEYMLSLTGDSLLRYKQKLFATGLQDCPFKIPKSLWTCDILTWPDVEYGDIYNYLIQSPGITQKHMANYKSLDSYTYFRSGWVNKIYTINPDKDDNIVLIAEVKPSYRLNDPNHTAWVSVKKSGKINAAHCTCKAGLGETCSHVGAILFKVEGAVKLGLTSTACTSEACEWNNFYTDDVKAERIANISFYSDEAKQKVLNGKNKTKQLPEIATSLERNSFLNNLKQVNPDAIVMSTFSSHSAVFEWKKTTSASEESDSLPKPIKAILTSINSLNLSPDQLANAMAIDETQILNVESSTLDQSSNPLWYSQRAGRITASKAYSVMHTNVNKPSKSLIAAICDSTTVSMEIPALKWGRDKEEVAVAAFKDFFCNEKVDHVMTYNINVGHERPNVKPAGFKICQKFPWIGASPDGHLECECCGKGLLEIKCPFKYASIGLFDDFFNDKSSHLDKSGALKKGHKYYCQVQLQMYVCQIKYCLLVTWSPVNSYITKVMFDDIFASNMVSELNTFWINCIVPQLMNEVPAPSNPQEENTIYCICQEIKDEPMVGCDNDTCEYKWYHFSCIGLKSKPRSKVWICKKCRRPGVIQHLK